MPSEGVILCILPRYYKPKKSEDFIDGRRREIDPH